MSTPDTDTPLSDHDRRILEERENPNRARLEAEVAARRQRKASQVEKPISAAAKEPEGIAAAMPGIIAELEALNQRELSFRASIRPDYDAAPDTEPCEIHDDIPLAKDFDATATMTRQSGRFFLVRARCPQCDADTKTADKRRYWARRGVPGRVIDATLKNFDTTGDESAKKANALTKVTAWLSREILFLILVGETGTGKGHLAAAALKHQGEGLFITQADMLADYRTGYADHTSDDLVKKWVETPLLVLDELGLSPGGKDEESMIYRVISKRYEDRRRTIFTSNLTVDELKEKLGFRLVDRIKESLLVVNMVWASHRTAKKE